MDENLEIDKNVYVCDASIYASIVPQNPTHMLAAHAVRLAHHLMSETEKECLFDGPNWTVQE